MLFSGNPDTLPKVYNAGDIVRFHRVKIQKFNDDIQGINTSGFSALVFDGTVGAPLIPRTSSKSYSFNSDDQKKVELLRDWAANNLKFPGSRVRLSDIQPVQFFDLICQLIGKAEMDQASYLLKVWDGTKCVSPTWKVCVEEEAIEGDRDFIRQLQNLTVDILVYDNHVETAKSIKIGSYIVIHSVHTKLHTVNSGNQPNGSYLEFYLHGGTSYGRGITVLPENNYDAQTLQKFLESVDKKDFQNLEDMSSCESADVFKTPLGQELLPFGVLERHQELSVTVLPAHRDWQVTPLTTVIQSKVPNKYRVRAQLQSFEPQNLYQSFKLHCTKCKSLQDVPDEDEVNIIFQGHEQNASPNPNVLNTSWYQSVVWETNNQKNTHIVLHFVKKNDIQQNPEDTLIMIEGGTFQDIFRLSRHFDSIIPVKCNQGELKLDLSGPFLIQGNRWHYGCSSCSKLRNPEALSSLCSDVSWSVSAIAKALGVEPLKHTFVMCFKLEDETGFLNAYLWNYSEQFFQIPASEIFVDDKLQEQLQSIMNALCPPRKQRSEYPWLECCIRSYNATNEGKQQVCYEIFDTIVTKRI
ncbi:protection of telomeres protein 1 isoform X2 [Spea bombifrons]|nr:protection of telomeres protein 1 isoform X2 [Spea bombifrons]